MTDKNAETVRKRRRFVSYAEYLRTHPAPDLYVDQEFSDRELPPRERQSGVSLEDISTLVGILRSKEDNLLTLGEVIRQRNDMILKMHGDIRALKDQLADPRLFIQE